MQEEPFLLNHRFKIDPARSTVIDTALQMESRLEHRLMNLLLLLCNHAGKLVARETITKEIWNDYGNADESLTQAISYLRKVLADDQKKLIETIPKKGYILYAELESVHEKALDSKNDTKPSKRKLVWLISIVAILLITGYFIFRSSEEKPSTRNPDMLPTEKVQKTIDTAKGADVVR